MAKKKKKQTARKPQKKQRQKKNVPSKSLLPQIISAAVAFLVIYFLYTNIQGYSWAWNNLLIGNLDMIEQYPDITRAQKYEAKEHMDARMVIYIAENTPEDAVILMPPDSLIKNNEAEKFKYFHNKAWCKYFVYPRELVYEREKGANPLYNKVTHVTIFNFWGYDKLNYEVPQKTKYAVLPITKNVD